ncbi:hypothetical protein Tco_0190311 [Tanacetum coccineum]
MQQPTLNPEDILDPTTAMNMELVLMAKELKLNYSTPANNNSENFIQPTQEADCTARNWVVQNPGNENGNVVAARAKGNAHGNNGNQIRCYNYKGIGIQIGKALVYDSDGTSEVPDSYNCYDNEIFNMFTQEEQYTKLLDPISEPQPVQQNNNNVIPYASKVEQSEGNSMDISKITRKPSKTGKHGHENGRVYKSRKPKPEKVKL